MERIGFIGIGLMGQRMGKRLLAAGHPLTVWNRSAGKCTELLSLGATEATDISTLVGRSDMVMLCVSDTAAVEQVVFDNGGIADSARPGQLLVDFSSIDPTATRRFATRLRQLSGTHWVDAPVSGGVGGAESGKLVIMAGGDEDDIERLRPVASALSQRLTRMGPTGSGQATKVCNQLIVAANAMLIAEAVALAERSGVDAGLLAPALAGGFADSLPLQILAPRMASRQFAPVQWKVATLLKDLDNAAALARECGTATPLAALANQRLRMHATGDNAQRDLASIIELFQP